jgi:hypothetical protein
MDNNNLANAVTLGVLSCFVGYRLYEENSVQKTTTIIKTDDINKKKLKEKAESETKTSLQPTNIWVARIEKTELIFKGIKKCFKYPQKFLKKLKIVIQTGNSSGLFDCKGFSAWLISPEAKKLGVILTGSLCITTYNGGFKGLSGMKFNRKFISVGGSLLEASRQIAVTDHLINSLVGFVKQPKDHILPLLVVGAMMAVSYTTKKS